MSALTGLALAGTDPAESSEPVLTSVTTATTGPPPAQRGAQATAAGPSPRSADRHQRRHRRRRRHHPRPRPAGYVNQAGPAVVHLPRTRIAADPVVRGRISRHRTGTTGGPWTRASVASSTVPAVVPSPGSWSVERDIDRMVHYFALPSSPTADQYLACAGSGNTPVRQQGPVDVKPQFVCYRVDRTLNTQTVVPLPDDWFCSAAVHDENGDIVTAGGTRAYPSTNQEVAGTWGGLKSTYRYDTFTGAITRLGDMAVGRWYPNLFKDQNDDIFVQGGQDNGVLQPTWEEMPRGQSTWTTLPFKMAVNSYADMQLIGPDTVAYTGASSSATRRTPFILDMANWTATPVPGLRDVASRRVATGFLAYPAQDEKVLVAGGGAANNTGSTSDMDMIDYSSWPAAVPGYVPRASLPTPMMFVQMVNLPNGQIFATGGSSAWRSGDVLWAGFYDIATDTWQLVTPPTVGRDYHTAMWVNTDGTVSISGGNPSATVFHPEVETYRPWYLDQARPVLDATSLPPIGAGQALSLLTKGAGYSVHVDLPPGTSLGSFTLDAARAATHVTSDSDQAMFSVPFTVAADGSVSITVPDSAMLTPGAYRLSAVTTDGVPSTGVWVKVG